MIVCENLVKIYKTNDIEVVALQGLDLQVDPGELIAIIGNSGSGKSTLLNMLGGLDRPSAGKLWVDGKDLLKFTDRELVKYKRETVGFVWQNNARNLIPYLTAQENVELPMMMLYSDKKRSIIYLIWIFPCEPPIVAHRCSLLY
jgi:ABC-type lipoprotein export system ATPase subunit